MLYYPILERETFWNHLPLYTLLSTLFLVLFIYIYIKLKYPFWNTQPVFHSYDYWRYWTSKCFPIQHNYPLKTKYCNFKNVQTIEYLEASENQRKDFVNLLQCYYIPDESALFVFNLTNLDVYMTGHNHPCFLSFYNEDYYTPSDSSIKIVQKPVGCISARSVVVYFFNMENTLYFWDFICVEREKRSNYLSRNLIQTQEFRQRQESIQYLSNNNSEKPILSSIFKKEIDLCEGIVPLVEYNTEIFLIKNEKMMKLPTHYVLLEIGKTNFHLLVEFLEIYREKMVVFGHPEMNNLLGLIEHDLLKVYCIQKAKDIYAVYFFRDSRTQYDGKGVLLNFCGSIHNSNSSELFYTGFLHSINFILKKNSLFSLLAIENISHNSLIYEKYKINSYSYGTSKSAYYLYNYVVPKQPFSPNEIFLLF